MAIRRATAGVVLVLVAVCVPSLARGQGRILPALSGERTLFFSTAGMLEQYQAQMRFSLEGSLVGAELDGDVSRRSVDDGEREALFSWDAVFNISDTAEIGARLQLSYRDDPIETWLGPELFGAGLRIRVAGGEDGSRVTLGVAAGKQVSESGATILELDGAFGFRPAEVLNWDLDVAGTADIASDRDTLFTAVVATGPLYRPIDWLSLSADLGGRLGNQIDSEDMFWDVAAALRIGFALGKGHTLDVAARQTVVGAWAESETGVLLTWRIRWDTEEGFLRLDNDGGPPPEPPEGESTLNAP